MNLEDLDRKQLMALVRRQALFIEAMREAANGALAHANHIASNYAKDIPDDILRAWARAGAKASDVLMTPTPSHVPMPH